MFLPSSKDFNRSGLTPLFTADHRSSLFEHCSKFFGNVTEPEHIYQNKIPNA